MIGWPRRTEWLGSAVTGTSPSVAWPRVSAAPEQDGPDQRGVARLRAPGWEMLRRRRNPGAGGASRFLEGGVVDPPPMSHLQFVDESC
jgi:hypothetical protein